MGADLLNESVYTGNRIVPIFGKSRRLRKMKPDTCYLYILKSKKDDSFYVGQCSDLDSRMSKHFDGFSKYTASKRPLSLVYFELYHSRSEAIKRERQVKKMKSRKYIQELIANWRKDW